MADPTITFGASDPLNLTALDTRWVPQGDNPQEVKSFAQKDKANGDVSAESSAFNEGDANTVNYKWCGDTALGKQFGDTVGTPLKVGTVRQGFAINSIAVTSNNNDYLGVAFAVHNHDDAAHADSTIGAHYSIPATVRTEMDNGCSFGCIDYFNQESTTVGAQNSTYTISAEHAEAEKGNGDHFAGTYFRGSEVATVSYKGGDTGIAPDSTWIADPKSTTTVNNDFVAVTLNAHRWIARDT